MIKTTYVIRNIYQTGKSKDKTFYVVYFTIKKSFLGITLFSNDCEVAVFKYSLFGFFLTNTAEEVEFKLVTSIEEFLEKQKDNDFKLKLLSEVRSDLREIMNGKDI